MYAIILFGVLMVIISAYMVADPVRWSGRIVQFSHSPFFHPAEVISRIVIGCVFLISGNQTSNPDVMVVIGYLLLSVGVGLALTPPSYHKRFAVWSAYKFQPFFRPAGLVSLAFGLFLIMSAVQGPVSQ